MDEITLIPPALWRIREPGVLALSGTDHITIRLNLGSMALYTVHYRGELITNGKHATLGQAKAQAMSLPALLLDFGMEP